jgi:hypothetical protein
MWGGPREVGFRLEVFESGRLVVSGRESVERTLPGDTAARLVEIGTMALGDFSSLGCNMVKDGMNADLYLMIDGEWSGSVCRNSLDWPRGAETRRLLDEISRQLPSGVKLPVEF